MRKQLLWFLGLAGLLALPAIASGPNVHGPNGVDFYAAVDVPTDVSLPLPSTTVLPWDLVRHRTTSVPDYDLDLSPAGDLFTPLPTTIDACHVRNDGHWLFSVEAPMDDPFGSGALFQPNDVILHDPVIGTYTHFFCGAPWGVPPGVNVDAAYLKDRSGIDGPLVFQPDDATLVLSFDAPTDLSLAGPEFPPGDLLEFRRVGAACDAWVFLGREFNSAAAGIPWGVNLTAADERGGTGTNGVYRLVLSFDVPLDDPSFGGTTYLPGDLVAWDPAAGAFDPAPYHRDPAWPVAAPVEGYTSRLNALCFPAPPGSIPCDNPNALYVDKGPGVGRITLNWTDSCSVGAEDYGIHEGTIGAWYSHDDIDCTDNGGDRTEVVNTAAGSSYYLVVPYNANDEGSYGRAKGLPLPLERPVSAPFANCDTNGTDMRELSCPP
ncbi:MAG: hypothetical protein GY716_01510 [bacterium]|nr:hypothetical protein [bacterium]